MPIGKLDHYSIRTLDVEASRRYRARRDFGAAVVAHRRELGSYLEGARTESARRHHTPEAVMREIAVTRDYV